MALHLKWRVEVPEAMFTLRQVAQVEVLLFFAVDVTLHVHHQLNVIIQHLVTKPTLKNKI
jgi:hypothetical protein